MQNVVLKVNQQYIASAAQNDEYRTEPAFKLQGSYRNMNKMAEKVSAAMNDDELMRMIEDHYQGEAQLLTGGAEENLLKLAELRGNITQEETARWEAIKQEFQRNRLARKADVEIGLEIAEKFGEISVALKHSDAVLESGQVKLQTVIKHVVKHLHHIHTSIGSQAKSDGLELQLKEIATGLLKLQVSLEESSGKSPLAEELREIARGIKVMGVELSEVSDTSVEKLNWLTQVGKK